VFRVERPEAERDVARIIAEMLADGLVLERPVTMGPG